MEKKLVLLLPFLFLCTVTVAQAPEDFALKLELVEAGGTEVVVVGSWKVDHVQGWSWGVCNNPDEASIGDCAGQAQPPNPCDGGCANTTCPDDMAKPGPQGQSASFHSLNIYEGGLTQGVVLDFMQTWDLLAKDRFEMLKIKYVLKDGVKTSRLDFCSTLGSPPVDTTFVVEGNSIAPATKEGVEIGESGGECKDLALNLGDPVVEGDAGQQTAKIPVLLTTGEGHEVSGLQLGVALDSADVVVDKLDEGQALTDAGGVDFFGVQIVEGGVTLGVVVDLEPEGDPPVFRTLPACTENLEIAVVNVVCAGAANGQVSATATLSGELGDPQVAIVVDVDGTSLIPEVGSGKSFTLECAGVVREKFVRADANQDGSLNVSDAVAIAKAVFGMGSKLALIEKCMDSADANDDGKVDTSDAVYLLEYLFTGGAAVPAPNVCGVDPTDDELDCPEYPPCPQD